MTGNWRDRFEPRQNPNVPPFAGEPPPHPHYQHRAADPIVDPFSGEGALSPRGQTTPDDEDTPDLDPAEYRPWVLQRVRNRPAIMLDLRRYDPKGAQWTGWAMAYPHLIAVEYIGDHLLSLDFGTRQFMIEGSGLRELTRRIQDGTALGVLEYCQGIWPSYPVGPVVTAIRPIGSP